MYNLKPMLMLMSKPKNQLLLLPKHAKQNPSCMNCLFCISEFKKYKKHEYILEYKCTQFKNEIKNKITKNISYENIFECRNDENKCGKSGKYYVPFSNLY